MILEIYLLLEAYNTFNSNFNHCRKNKEIGAYDFFAIQNFVWWCNEPYKNNLLMIYFKVHVCLANDVIVALKKKDDWAKKGTHLSVKETPFIIFVKISAKSFIPFLPSLDMDVVFAWKFIVTKMIIKWTDLYKSQKECKNEWNVIFLCFKCAAYEFEHDIDVKNEDFWVYFVTC